MTRRITTAGLRAAVSVIALLVLVAVALYYLGTVGLRVGDRGVRTASLTIPQSNGLVVGSRVLLRGVAIGRVTSVETSVRGVAVGWNYGDRYRIPVDSLFRVDNLSALGETYLGVIPQRDGGPTFDDRATIDTTKVTVPTTLDELAARVVRMLEQVNVKQLRSIINEVNKGLPSDPTVLSNIASASALLETTILSTRGSLDRLLTDFQPLLVKGAGIAPAMAAAGDPVERFAVGLGKFIGEGGKTAATSRSGTDGFIVATHAVLCGNAVERLNSADVEKILFADTVPVHDKKIQRLEVCSMAQLLARAIDRIHHLRRVAGHLRQRRLLARRRGARARARQADRLRPRPDAPAQPHPRHARRRVAVVRLVRLQRRFRPRSLRRCCAGHGQHLGCYGLRRTVLDVR